MNKGKVYLVGAGPGDAGLITLKGIRAIQLADCIVYDFHINPRLLTYAKDGAEFIYAGKRGGHHEMTQDEINRVLVEKAKEGKIVCRLKGGDPFVFGRGGEEVEILYEEGIEFEIIPGVSSVIAVPAYAGIPVTHRKIASAFTVITGNEDLSKQDRIFTHIRASNAPETMIFLMCVKNLDTITSKLIQEGLKPETPSAIIRWGTRPEQKIVTGTISEIAHLAKEHKISPPAILVIGDVVGLREKLNWYEKKPLHGHRVLITRHLTDEYLILEDMGAELFVFPTIDFLPPEDFTDLDRAIEKIGDYSFIVFPSPRAVKFFFERFLSLGKDMRDLKGVLICAVGRETAKNLKNYGINADIIPEEYNSEAMAKLLKVEIYRFGQNEKIRALYPCSDIALKGFSEEMEKAGIQVDAPITYRTVKPTEHGKRLVRFLREGKITIATFTSPSSFNNLIDILKDDAKKMLNEVAIAVIGKTTAKAVEGAGYKVSIMPEKSTIKDMVEAIIRWVQQK
ncbi:uroporphyrinogen-III C-methyltransferase [Thermodesulfovibrio yellowstonii]|uniref:uroporphyrinogen-III C-methyltransferase n=1 Tax=Thermodesulfovibrio yellowstonii TaxID=28262 RepID=A0A9W6GEL3_9BACT|nr:uroporphyrinogen-III C-methyltransferase [Thermodesulfovibrio islandicus]GLI53889.1 uroporphyrinogen III methyltransferase [Thermodesulfovibrio islandicus]